MLLSQFITKGKKSRLVESVITEDDMEFGPETGKELYPAGYASDGKFVLHIVTDLLPRIRDDELSLQIMNDVTTIEAGKASKEEIKRVMNVFKAAQKQGITKKYKDAIGKFDQDYKDDPEHDPDLDEVGGYKLPSALQEPPKKKKEKDEPTNNLMACDMMEDETDEDKIHKLKDVHFALATLHNEVGELSELDSKMDSSGLGDLHDQISTMKNLLGKFHQVMDRADKVVPRGTVGQLDAEELYGSATEAAPLGHAKPGVYLDPEVLKTMVTKNREKGEKEKESLKKWREKKFNEDGESDEARELVLYADNDEGLYTRSAVPVMKNLTRKWDKGIYDHELAKKLWKYHADRAAKKYGMEHGNGDGFKIFSPSDRREAASEFADYWQAELEAGNKMESRISEDDGASAEDVAGAISHRFKVNSDLLSKALKNDRGIEGLMDAIEEISEHHAGAEEIGSSDVSIMVREVMAQLGATMEMKQEDGAKPDFLDLDKDGNKKEPMKKAADDALVCKDCGCEKGDPKPGCDCPHDCNADGPHWVRKESRNESKSSGDAWYREQDAKDMAEKDGKDWKSMKYGHKEEYRAKVKAKNENKVVKEYAEAGYFTS